MKSLLSSLMIGAAAFAGSAAHASSTIAAQGFTLAWAEGLSRDPFDMTVLSSANGLTRIGLDVGLPDFALDTTTGGGATGDSSWHRLAGTVEQGYRITAMTLSATIDGRLFLQSLPCDLCTSTEASASNGVSFGWAVTEDGQRVELPGSALENVVAPTQLALTSSAQIDGVFGLDLTLANAATAQQGFQFGYVNGQWYWERYLEAGSNITISDLALTVQVTAVPEPATYAMLLAGLCVAGWAARRRQA